MKNLIIVGFVAALGVVSLALFFPDLFESLRGDLSSNDPVVSDEMPADEIVVAYPHDFRKLWPTAFNPQARAGLLNIYEGLVKVNENLQIEPGIAASWGRIDDFTWEFRIRPQVLFHDGSVVQVDDVIASINRAKGFENSELKSLLANVLEVKPISDDKIHIVTASADPLLVSKIATVLIFPEEFTEFEVRAIGTGPYELVGWSEDGGLKLRRFKNYWGENAKFENANLRFIPNASQRVQALVDGEVDLVVNVPPAGVRTLESAGFNVISRPNLQVNFLLFNFNNAFLAHREVRSALRWIFDKNEFLNLTGGYARPVNQFVSNGVFGYNPGIPDAEFNPENTRDVILRFSGIERPVIDLHMLVGLEKFGEYIATQMEAAGLGVELKYMSGEELDESVKNRDGDMYFFGWRSELGDANDFFKSVAHGRSEDERYGIYNPMNYNNKTVNALIEMSEEEFDVEKRKEHLQRIMRLLVNEDVVGIPLYESEVIYGFSSDLKFIPRVDSYVLINEIK